MANKLHSIIAKIIHQINEVFCWLKNESRECFFHSALGDLGEVGLSSNAGCVRAVFVVGIFKA